MPPAPVFMAALSSIVGDPEDVRRAKRDKETKYRLLLSQDIAAKKRQKDAEKTAEEEVKRAELEELLRAEGRWRDSEQRRGRQDALFVASPNNPLPAVRSGGATPRHPSQRRDPGDHAEQDPYSSTRRSAGSHDGHHDGAGGYGSDRGYGANGDGYRKDVGDYDANGRGAGGGGGGGYRNDNRGYGNDMGGHGDRNDRAGHRNDAGRYEGSFEEGNRHESLKGLMAAANGGHDSNAVPRYDHGYDEGRGGVSGYRLEAEVEPKRFNRITTDGGGRYEREQESHRTPLQPAPERRQWSSVESATPTVVAAAAARQGLPSARQYSRDGDVVPREAYDELAQLCRELMAERNSLRAQLRDRDSSVQAAGAGGNGRNGVDAPGGKHRAAGLNDGRRGRQEKLGGRSSGSGGGGAGGRAAASKKMPAWRAAAAKGPENASTVKPRVAFGTRA